MESYTLIATPGDIVHAPLYGDSTAWLPREIKINLYVKNDKYSPVEVRT
jgi:hypothetical protein